MRTATGNSTDSATATADLRPRDENAAIRSGSRLFMTLTSPVAGSPLLS